MSAVTPGARWTGLGVPLDVVDPPGARVWIRDALASGRTGWIATPNPEIAVAAWRNPALRAALGVAALCLADGVGMLWGSRLLGGPLRSRVPGIDLLEDTLSLCAAEGWPVYFLGARPGVAAEAATQAAKRWAGLAVAGSAHGYFAAADAPTVLAGVSAARPRLLVVGMGHPRQETWLAENSPRLPGVIGIACGGSLDVLAGRTTRAPAWARRLGLEWLYRIVRAPRERLGRSRSLVVFAFRVAAIRLGLAPRFD